VASRSGAISVFDTQTGKELSSFPIGKGVDDLAFDSTSKRIYAPCGGDGLIYVYEQRSQDAFTLIGKVPSGPGGKNALLDKPLGRYFVIVPPQGSAPGAVYAYALQ
jgi:DNA-binding beta-propeller fold protein YncE